MRARTDLQSWLEAVLPPEYPNIAILVDEVSGVPAHARERFFSQLRALFNSRATRAAEAIANRVFFVFAGTFRPEAMIDSDNSPFNVSKLHITDWLRADQVGELAAIGLGDVGPEFGEKAFEAVGGQPYLVQRVLAAVQRVEAADRMSAFEEAVDEIKKGVDRHVPDLMRLVSSDPELLVLTKRLVAETVTYDGADPSHSFAVVSGVAVVHEEKLVVSIALYEQALSTLHGRDNVAEVEPTTPRDACDVLLVTATEVETAAVRDVFAEGEAYTRGNNAYRDLGVYGHSQVVLVRSAQTGAGGAGGAALTVADAIRELRPAAVIAVGIAFGMNPADQQLSDVLCATHVVDYELGRVGTTSEGERSVRRRGEILGASPGLLSRLQDVAVGLERIEFGWLLSGDKLIDNVGERDGLAEAFPDAIGGEMEAYGAASAANRAKVEWGVAKAICDWADGDKAIDKPSRQRAAAVEAAKFVRQLLDAGGGTPG